MKIQNFIIFVKIQSTSGDLWWRLFLTSEFAILFKFWLWNSLLIQFSIGPEGRKTSIGFLVYADLAVITKLEADEGMNYIAVILRLVKSFYIRFIYDSYVQVHIMRHWQTAHVKEHNVYRWAGCGGTLVKQRLQGHRPLSSHSRQWFFQFMCSTALLATKSFRDLHNAADHNFFASAISINLSKSMNTCSSHWWDIAWSLACANLMPTSSASFVIRALWLLCTPTTDPTNYLLPIPNGLTYHPGT